MEQEPPAIRSRTGLLGASSYGGQGDGVRAGC